MGAQAESGGGGGGSCMAASSLLLQYCLYREEKKSLQILLSYSQAGPGRKAKQGQEEISRNHVQRLFLGSA